MSGHSISDDGVIGMRSILRRERSWAGLFLRAALNASRIKR